MNIIDRAADRLRGRWRKGDLGDIRGDGPVCLRGAFTAVGHKLTADQLMYRAVLDAARADGKSWRSLSNFNDNPTTTEEDVLLCLKHASALYDERTGQAS